jgi:hypothetical protein
MASRQFVDVGAVPAAPAPRKAGLSIDCVSRWIARRRVSSKSLMVRPDLFNDFIVA